MATAKKSVGFRLSEDTIKELDTIAKREKVSQADVITIHGRFINQISRKNH